MPDRDLPAAAPAVTVTAARRWHPDLIPFKPYVYRGLGFDVLTGEGDDDDA